MALTKCTECGHPVSDLARTCPNCGAPWPSEEPLATRRPDPNQRFVIEGGRLVDRTRTDEDKKKERERQAKGCLGCLGLLFILLVLGAVLSDGGSDSTRNDNLVAVGDSAVAVSASVAPLTNSGADPSGANSDVKTSTAATVKRPDLSKPYTSDTRFVFETAVLAPG